MARVDREVRGRRARRGGLLGLRGGKCREDRLVHSRPPASAERSETQGAPPQELAAILRRAAREPGDLLPGLVREALARAAPEISSPLALDAYLEAPERWSHEIARHLATVSFISPGRATEAVMRAIRTSSKDWSPEERAAVERAFEALAAESEGSRMGAEQFQRQLAAPDERVEPPVSRVTGVRGFPAVGDLGFSEDAGAESILTGPPSTRLPRDLGRYEWFKARSAETAAELRKRLPDFRGISDESLASALAALRAAAGVREGILDILEAALARGSTEGALVEAGWRTVRGRAAHALGAWFRSRRDDPAILDAARRLARDPSPAVRAAFANVLAQFWEPGLNRLFELAEILLAGPEAEVISLTLSTLAYVATPESWPRVREVLERQADSPGAAIRALVTRAFADEYVLSFPGAVKPPIDANMDRALRCDLARDALKRSRTPRTRDRARAILRALASGADAGPRKVLSVAFKEDAESEGSRSPGEPFDFELAATLLSVGDPVDLTSVYHRVYGALARKAPSIPNADLGRVMHLLYLYLDRSEDDRRLLDPYDALARAAFEALRAILALDRPPREPDLDEAIGKALDRFLEIGLPQVRAFARDLAHPEAR